MLEIGEQIIRTLMPFLFTYVMIEIICGVVRGTGEAVVPMIITCVGVCVLRVVWMKVIVPMYMTLPVLLYSYPITWTVTSIVFLIYYYKGNWLKRRLAKTPTMEQLTDII